MSENKHPNLKAEAVAMLDILNSKKGTAAYSFDKATGNAVLSKEVAAELIDVESYKKLSAQITNANAALAQFAADECLPAFKENKDLKDFNLNLAVEGRDAFNVSIERVRSYGSGDTATTKFGVMTVGLDMYANNKGAGQLKKVRTSLNDAAAAALAD